MLQSMHAKHGGSEERLSRSSSHPPATRSAQFYFVQVAKVRAELADATAAVASSKEEAERLLILEVENDRLRSQVR
jgi:hypothetical protein